MGIIKSTYTIEALLKDASTLPIADMPFGYLILHTLPTEIRVYPTDPAQQLYDLLQQHPKGKKHLNTLVEDLIEIEDGKTKRRVFRVIAWLMILGTLSLLGTIIYIALVKREFPSWDQMMWCLGPSAWVVVDKFGALTKDKFKQMGEAIRTFKSKRNNREGESEREESYRYNSRNDYSGDPFKQEEDDRYP